MQNCEAPCLEMHSTQNDFDFLDLKIQNSPLSSRKRTKSLNCSPLIRVEGICEILRSVIDEEPSRSKSPLGKSEENRPAPDTIRHIRRASNPCRVIPSVNWAEMKRRSVPLLNIDETALLPGSAPRAESTETAKILECETPECLLNHSNVQLPAPLTKKVQNLIRFNREFVLHIYFSDRDLHSAGSRRRPP